MTSSRRLLPAKDSRSTLDRTISVKVFAQGGQRVAGVRKGGPVGDRPGETLGVRRRDTDPQFLTEQAGTQRQDFRMQRPGLVCLHSRLVLCVGGQERLVVKREPSGAGPWTEHVGDSCFPVDQGPVAVEAQCFDVGEPHRKALLSPGARTLGPAPAGGLARAKRPGTGRLQRGPGPMGTSARLQRRVPTGPRMPVRLSGLPCVRGRRPWTELRPRGGGPPSGRHEPWAGMCRASLPSCAAP